jgi:hypothetical protein
MDTKDIAAYHHDWYLRHKPEHLARTSAYQKTHKDEMRGYRAKYYKKNRSKIEAQGQQRHQANPARRLLAGAKARAKREGLAFNLVLADVIIPEFCPVLGMKLVASTSRMHPDSPSLDKINSVLGYVKGNVIVVSWRANHIKTDATPLELMKVANFYAGVSHAV